ncbi:hypothetical protein [Mesorhizobium sp. M0006]|uniref:hypothetical protein n=1 Tax=Mesorhizobium sp. M0006 TaxID=2956838 RepID=UPI0033392ED6
MGVRLCALLTLLSACSLRPLYQTLQIKIDAVNRILTDCLIAGGRLSRAHVMFQDRADDVHPERFQPMSAALEEAIVTLEAHWHCMPESTWAASLSERQLNGCRPNSSLSAATAGWARAGARKQTGEGSHGQWLTVT